MTNSSVGMTKTKMVHHLHDSEVVTREVPLIKIKCFIVTLNSLMLISSISTDNPAWKPAVTADMSIIYPFSYCIFGSCTSKKNSPQWYHTYIELATKQLFSCQKVHFTSMNHFNMATLMEKWSNDTVLILTSPLTAINVWMAEMCTSFKESEWKKMSWAGIDV